MSNNLQEIEKKLSPEIIRELLEKISEKNSFEIVEQENHIKTLKKLFSKYQKMEKIQVGDLVQWKENLKNRKKPQYNEPAIVLEILETPIIDQEENSASPYFREELNIVLGILDDDRNEFLIYYFDKKRFEKIKDN